MAEEIKDRSQELLDAASCRLSVETIRSLSKIQTNKLALRYLLTTDHEDRKDALDGLFRCCIKVVKKNRLYLAPRDLGHQPGSRDWVEDCEQETRLFVWLAVRRIIAPHEGKSRRHIVRAAIEGAFRHIPRLVDLRIRDELRRQRRERKHEFDRNNPRLSFEAWGAWQAKFEFEYEAGALREKARAQSRDLTAEEVARVSQLLEKAAAAESKETRLESARDRERQKIGRAHV